MYVVCTLYNIKVHRYNTVLQKTGKTFWLYQCKNDKSLIDRSFNFYFFY